MNPYIQLCELCSAKLDALLGTGKLTNVQMEFTPAIVKELTRIVASCDECTAATFKAKGIEP